MAFLRIFIVISALGITLGISACGDKTSSGSAASRGDTTAPAPIGSKLAECNRLSAPLSGVAGQIGTYYDPTTRRLREDHINVNLTQVPAELFTSSTLYFQFFRWYDTGTRVVNQIPVRMFFVDKLTGAIAPQNGTVDRLSKATLTQAKETFGSGWLNVKFEQFFERTYVVLTGMDFQFHGASIAHYNTAISTLPLGSGDMLLPPFYANPTVYKNYYPLAALYSLHPLYSYINSNATENDYFRMTEDICNELAGIGGRIPASAATAAPGFWSQIWLKITAFFSNLF